ncbi:MerR family transcriptional regulator [Isachenkonia alkalipeptolytica]|uniref:MerR family transcriptional regulator n=1 Tax=Isachenkonia alkalipeptolytica TaxID=2565777 RepID=A0AA44BGC7_9CLOT|nr:MerR family transcriptional regulator [Isachenkonia alkalipeptolytica]NBG89670.1 MerR family transcriptional regulator [Isachenkonia alkalipeptolytica]
MAGYNLQQLSEVTGIPRSTVAYYRDKYRQYFNMKGKGRNRRYLEPTEEVLLLIAELSADNKSQQEIEEALQEQFQQIHDIEEIRQDSRGTGQQLEKSLAIITESLQVMAEQKKEIEDLKDRVRQLEKKALEEEKQEAPERKNFFQRLLGK